MLNQRYTRLASFLAELRSNNIAVTCFEGRPAVVRASTVGTLVDSPQLPEEQRPIYSNFLPEITAVPNLLKEAILTDCERTATSAEYAFYDWESKPVDEQLARLFELEAKNCPAINQGPIETATLSSMVTLSGSIVSATASDHREADLASALGNRYIEWVPVADVQVDPSLCHRAKTSTAAVEGYKKRFVDGEDVSPVEVVFDGGRYWMTDGNARREAAIRVGRSAVQAVVIPGDLEIARRRAYAANTNLGKPRTRADKEAVIRAMLSVSEQASLPDRELARRACVSAPYIKTIRQMILEESRSRVDHHSSGASEGSGTDLLAAPIPASASVGAAPVHGDARPGNADKGKGVNNYTSRPNEQLKESGPECDLPTSDSALGCEDGKTATARTALETGPSDALAPELKKRIDALEGQVEALERQLADKTALCQILQEERDQAVEKAELAAEMALESEAENTNLRAAMESDDKMQAVLDENKNLRRHIDGLRSSMGGYMNEKNELIREVKVLRKKMKSLAPISEPSSEQVRKGTPSNSPPRSPRDRMHGHQWKSSQFSKKS